MRMHIINLLLYAEQKHSGCKKVRGQQEAAVSMCNQKVEAKKSKMFQTT